MTTHPLSELVSRFPIVMLNFYVCLVWDFQEPTLVMTSTQGGLLFAHTHSLGRLHQYRHLVFFLLLTIFQWSGKPWPCLVAQVSKSNGSLSSVHTHMASSAHLPPPCTQIEAYNQERRSLRVGSGCNDPFAPDGHERVSRSRMQTFVASYRVLLVCKKLILGLARCREFIVVGLESCKLWSQNIQRALFKSSWKQPVNR